MVPLWEAAKKTVDGGISELKDIIEKKKSTEAPPRRRKRDSKPFLNFKTVIAVISKLV